MGMGGCLGWRLRGQGMASFLGRAPGGGLANYEAKGNEGAGEVFFCANPSGIDEFEEAIG